MIKMCVRFYPKYDVELTWSSLRSGFAYAPDARICIRCGGPLRPRLEGNARSRVMNVQICPECGIDEALRDARDDVLPMSEWYIVKNHYFGEMYDPDTAVLMPNCRFSVLFCAKRKRLPPDNADYPVAFVASSRSDFDGKQWRTAWFADETFRDEKELLDEIDAFQNRLFRLPEFQSLRDMTPYVQALYRAHQGPIGVPIVFRNKEFLHLASDDYARKIAPPVYQLLPEGLEISMSITRNNETKRGGN